MATALNHFGSIFQMQFYRMANYLVFYAIIQILVSLGIVIGFTYMLPMNDPETILYLATGAPTFILIITGLVLMPQHIANSQIEGYVDFMKTWPVKRFLIFAVDSLIWLLITIPGIAISTLVAHLMFEPGYSISWTIIPTLLLIGLTSIGVGYGFSLLLPPQLSMALSQVLAFGALMFSPINFPMERLPEWMQTMHSVLPLHSMAEVMRASMASTTFEATSGDFITLIIWCVIGFTGAIIIFNKK